MRPLVAPDDASHAAECEFTGNVEMSVFQMLSDGNTEHVVPGGAAACADATGRAGHGSRAASSRTRSRSI